MIEIKETELSKKAYAKKFDVPLETVNLRIRSGNVKWRYLFPETEEYIVIDTTVIGRKQTTHKEIVYKNVIKETIFKETDK